MKAVLVIDKMPNTCRDCLFRIINIPQTDFDCYACKATRRIEDSDIKQPWCQLRQLPSKIEKEIEVEIKGKKYLISNWDFIRGWNTCLEEITGETDKEKLDDNVDITKKWARYCVCGAKMIATETGGWYCPSCHRKMKSILVKRVK